ncbi:MAG: UDP-N-acetylmuramate dehydrogenase [Sulfurimonas sp.]|jgi:UDP-N-acetylmuramate dehydrogenase|uniref:UDP-N-acetylmuramate dehydrogenase n=1 Tax=Sulfurimonas sp. TaxID=2022749 RepID=UPI0039E69BCE
MTTKTINFSKYSSIKIGEEIEVSILESPSDFSNKYYLLGSCNNTLIGTQPPPLMVLSKKYNYINIENGVLKIGGATPSGKVASFCKKNDIANFELVSHLPGTIGGLVYMNAGLKEYEIFNYLLNVTTIHRVLQKEEIDFGYRYTNISSPILEVSFELHKGFKKEKVEMFKKMRSNQPSTPSAGSCFKNPPGDYAGRLIEAVGLKGKRVGAIEFSQVHANFLVNHGAGTFDDAMHLIKEVQERVLEKFDIHLEREIIILDKRYMSDSLVD